MSTVDENGVRHPTAEDPFDVLTQAHLAFCRDCNPYALTSSVVGSEVEALVRWLKYRNTSVLSKAEVETLVMDGFR